MKKSKGVYIILFNTLLLLAVELFAHHKSHAVSILGEVFHMAGDLMTVGVGLCASFIMQRWSGGDRCTFGLARLEVLAAAISLFLIWSPSIYLVHLSVGRYFNPVPLDRHILLGTAFFSLVVNLVNFFVSLHMNKRCTGDMSITSIYIHALSDLMQCLGLCLSGLVLYIDSSLVIVDLLAAILSTAICFYGSLGLAREVAMMLLDASPVDVESVRNSLMSVSHVESVTDLKVWSISRSNRATMARVSLAEGAQHTEVVRECREVLHKEYSVGISNIEVY
ncbi:cobalt-zinc-cadmium efflux system protein [Nematocida minor]|uniref:cobalt-zinc-cadmium efflux system protein n=1 Tax=Nematocida minor TaxID=1912983 RepID=UPI002220C29E|nr:cobalt-zinc-cadmium efflux system protein [Nematocida minor]KAI5189713.1 cobalt-zinc-cadmium efflux system protein [Nematocida minor]